MVGQSRVALGIDADWVIADGGCRRPVFMQCAGIFSARLNSNVSPVHGP
jgi:hypothetical protein